MSQKTPQKKERKKTIEKQNKKPLPKGLLITKKVLSVILRAFLTVLLVGVISGTIVAGALTIYIFNGEDADTNIDLKKLQLNYTSIMYANNPQTGEPIEVERLHGTEDRVWVSFDKIPKYLKEAAIAIEDKRFYQHQGVDWRRTFYALFNSFSGAAGRQGGSTITQQLIKNLKEDDEVSFARKIREIRRALEFEKKNDKDSILEAYLNTIHLGNGCQGVQSASIRYFGKSVDQLNLAECASIIGITQYPTRYNPLINPDHNKEKQELVLKEMFDQGKITQAEYDEAVAYKLVFQKVNPTDSNTKIQSYYTDMVIEDVIRDLQSKMGYEKSYATQLIYNGGLRIYSAVDLNVQKVMEEVYSDPENFPEVNAAVTPESAMMIMNYEGRILGVTSGIGKKTTNRGWNMATRSKRQVGSAMKPLSAYAPAIENNQVNWSSLIPNEPFMYQGSMYPINYGNAKTGGNVTIQDALARSLNTVAARLVNDMGLENSFNFCVDRFHCNSLIRYAEVNGKVLSDITLSSLALGGMTDGLTVREITSAFQTFGNGGNYYDSYSYFRVEDSEGNVLLENQPMPAKVIGSDTAYVMNRLMTTVVSQGNGTGYAAGFRRGNMDIFAKTGTSGTRADSTDFWFVGGTPYYLGGAWYGYKIPKGMPSNLRGGARDAWKKIMEKLHEDLPGKEFEKDPGVVVRTYCKDTGLLASSSCKNRGTGYYKSSSGGIPPVCAGHNNTQTTNDQSTDVVEIP